MGWELPGGVNGNWRGSVVCRWAVGGCRSSCTLRLGLCLAGEPPSLTLCLRRSLAYRLREAGVSEASARDLARQPAPVPQDPDRAFDAPDDAPESD